SEEGIEGAVRERDVGWLVHLIRQGNDLTPEVREYLACVIGDLLTGKRSFPSRRPKKKGLSTEKEVIAEKVWAALKSQGHTLPVSYANGRSRLMRGSHSVKVGVAAVAKEMRCSTTKVYNVWSGFDPRGYELKKEKRTYDAQMECYYDFPQDEAIQALKEEHGDREFTHDEITTAMGEIEARAREDYRDYDDF